jgi:tetratricopeptide (TPR) repeat protein
MVRIKRNITAVLGFLVFIVIFGCAGMESYKVGEQLSKSNRWDEAIVYYEKAVQQNPANKKYQQKLSQARHEAANVHYKRARQQFSSLSDLNLLFLDQILREAKRAHTLDPKNAAISSFYNDLNTKRNDLLAEIKTLYTEAQSDLQKEDWMPAITKLRRINDIFPGYEDTGDKLATAEQEGAKFFYKQGLEFGKGEDWKQAARSFRTAMDINPDFLDVEKLYNSAKSKDNINYYINAGNKNLKEKKPIQALVLYERALEYQPDNRKLSEEIELIKKKLAKQAFDQAVQLTRRGKLYGACEKINLAGTYSSAIQEGTLYKELCNNLSDRLVARADRYSKRSMWGNALVWLQKVEEINPDYEALFYKILEVKDAITKRITKSIAVFDFGSPCNNKDAGKIVASKLITFLHTESSGDVRIIERESLQSILREMQLGQTGLVDVKTARAAKMKGIDTFILGNVLQYAVESKTHRSSKQVKVLVDTEMVANPDFQLWLIQHPRPTQQDLKYAPPRERPKKNYQLVSYNSGVTKISTLIEIAYRLVDTKTGENLSTDTMSGKLVKEDQYQDEVPMASIPYDSLDLPSEMEVMDELSNKKVSELGQSVLKHFQSLEVEYFNKAHTQLKRRRYEDAVERFMDALHDEKLKRISTPISQKSHEMIEKLIRNK